MKNKHILPNTEVPIELRKEVYKEALRIIKANEKKYKFQYVSNWLCWLLPSVLYNIDIWGGTKHQVFFNGFKHNFAENMFPEINKFLENHQNICITNKERINFLKSVI